MDSSSKHDLNLAQICKAQKGGEKMSENNQEFSLNEGSLLPKEKVQGSNPTLCTMCNPSKHKSNLGLQPSLELRAGRQG